MRRVLTPDDRRLIAKMARRSDLTYEQIGRRFGITATTVSSIAMKDGIQRRRNWTASEIAFLKENYQRCGARGCGKILRRDHQVVSFKARQLGLHTDVGPYGKFRVPFVAGLDRPRITTVHGHVRQYDTKKNILNKEAIRQQYELASISQFGRVAKASAHTPVKVRVETYSELPKSRPKSIESEEDTYKPDIDNVIKLVLDALNEVAWKDDAQVVGVIAYKHERFRGENPHTDVTIDFG